MFVGLVAVCCYETGSVPLSSGIQPECCLSTDQELRGGNFTTAGKLNFISSVEVYLLCHVIGEIWKSKTES